MEHFIFDTSALLENPNLLDIPGIKKIIPSIVLEELDGLKNKYYSARKIIRKIVTNTKDIEIYIVTDKDLLDEFPEKRNDNIILSVAKRYGGILFTADACMYIKALFIGVQVFLVDIVDNLTYNGFFEVDVKDNEDKITEIYQNNSNPFNLLINQYLILRDGEDVLDVLRYTGNEYVKCSRKNCNSTLFGQVKPLDVYQQCFVDSLYNNKITMVRGKAGSGKTFLSLAFSFSMLEKGKFDKIVIFCNPLSPSGVWRGGYYPGTRDEKLLSSSVGSMLLGKFGDYTMIERLINEGKLLLLPLSDLRGFDTGNMKAIVYISEAQNMNAENIKMALQRVGQEAKVIIDGDVVGQIDNVKMLRENGMIRVSEVFRGNSIYGEIELKNIYRSEIAKIADALS